MRNKMIVVKDKRKLITGFALLGKVVSSILVTVGITLSLLVLVQHLSTKGNVSPFGFKSVHDWLLFLGLVAGYAVPIAYFFKQRLNGSRLTQYLMLAMELLSISLIPVVYYQPKITTGGLHTFITQVNVYFVLTFVLIVIGALSSLYLVKDKILKEKQNWYAVLVLAPYSAFAYYIVSSFTTFRAFNTASAFNANLVVQVMKLNQNTFLDLTGAFLGAYSMVFFILVTMAELQILKFLFKYINKWKDGKLNV